jgi:hypothetical protein
MAEAAAYRLLGVLVSVATPIVLVLEAVVVPSRVGSSSWDTTNRLTWGMELS